MKHETGMCPKDSCRADHDRNSPEIDLLSSLSIRSVTLRNRIVVSPMCQYCAKDGFADDWHLVHLGSRAVGGAALVFTEATAVTAQGRISAGDLGLWKDEHIEPLSRIAAFIDRMGAISGMPLFVRISATDWVEGGWDIDQSVKLSEELKKLGVDLIDVSSGGTAAHADIPVGPNYQVPFAKEIRHHCAVLTGAVGLITEPNQANDIVMSGSADLVFLAREMLRNPYFALEAEHVLNQAPSWPLQYGYAISRPKK